MCFSLCSLCCSRNCKILKKPGQYQDLMVLASTGSNEAFTYLHEDYGALGRKFRSPCFGFEGNVEPLALKSL